MTMPRKTDFPPIRRGGSLMLAWQGKGKTVLVVGGGHVAAGRIVHALEADAQITLVSPRGGLAPEVAHRIASGEITSYKDKDFEESDLEGVDLCLAAIDSPEASTRIWTLCKERRIPVNVADVPSECDFYFGSIHRDGPLQVMISTNGAAPKLANLIRRHIAKSLPINTGNGCQNVGKLRRKLRGIAPGPEEGSKRMKWMVDVCEQYSLDELVRLSSEDMDRLLAYYSKGTVPPYGEIHEERVVYEFDGGFGWHC